LFSPGYLILSLVDTHKSFRGTEKILLSVIISLLLLPFFGILAFALGSNIQENGVLMIVLLNSALLIVYALKKENINDSKGAIPHLNEKLALLSLFIFIAFVYIFSKYSLNLAWDYGDLNSYFGSALSFTKNVLPHSVIGPGAESPFWLFIFMAEFFVSSGLPYINAFQFILILLAFLPILSFYVMVSSFFKETKRQIPLIATVLGFFGGGLGWIYSIGLFAHTQTTQGLFNFFSFSAKIDSGYLALPTFPLYTLLPYYVAIATIFVMIWLVYSKNTYPNGIVRYALVSVTVAAGYLIYISLIVFFVFIFAASIIIWKRENLQLYRRYAISIILGLLLVALADAIMGGTYYTYGDALTQYGFSLFYGTLALAAFSYLLSFIKGSVWTNMKLNLKAKKAKIKVSISVLIAGFYGLCFVIVNEVLQNYGTLPIDNHVVPWYAWPVRLGISGLIALPGAIYLIKRSDDIRRHSFFIFLIPVSLLIGTILAIYPFYYEDRVTFLVMVPILILASFTLVTFSEKIRRVNLKGKEVLLGLVLTTILVLGFMIPLFAEEAIDYNYWSNGNGLSNYELEGLNFLRLNTPANSSVLALTARSQYLLPYAGLSDMQTRVDRDVSTITGISSIDSAFYILSQSHVKYIYIGEGDLPQLEDSNSFSGFIKDYLLKYLPIAFQNQEVTIYDVQSFSIPTISNTALVTPNLDTGYIADDFDQSYNNSNHLNFCSVLNLGNMITLETDNSHNNHDFTMSVNVDPNVFPYLTITWKTDGTNLNVYLVGLNTTYYITLGISASWKTTVINLNNFYDFVQNKTVSVQSNEQITDLIFRDFEPNSQYSIDLVQFSGFSNNKPMTNFLSQSMLAFSQSQYSTVIENDPAEFNYSTLILPQDLSITNPIEDQEFNDYMNWVNQGGHLIVLDSSGIVPPYAAPSLVTDNSVGWSQENLTEWSASGCSFLYNSNGVTVNTNSANVNHDFLSPAFNVSVGSYSDIVINWKTDGSPLFLDIYSANKGYSYIDMGSSTSWTTSVINLNNFYDVVSKTNESLSNDQIENMLFRNFVKNATYSVDSITFYKTYPLPPNYGFSNDLSLYEKNSVSANGIESQSGTLSFSAPLSIPVIASYDASVRTLANYTNNNMPVCPYIFTKTVGNGQITYLEVAPYFDAIEDLTGNISRSFFQNIGSLVNVANLSLNVDIPNWTIYFPQFDYVTNPVDLTGTININTEFAQFPNLVVARLSITPNNSDETKIIGFNNSVVTQVNYNYPVKSTLIASNVQLVNEIGIDHYSNIKINGNFNVTMQIPKNVEINVTILEGENNSVTESFTDSVITFYLINSCSSVVLVKSPTISLNDGTASFGLAEVYRNHYEMPLYYDDGSSPFQIVGNVTFTIEYCDNNVSFLSNFDFNGKWS
jgi:hypothetical protein